MKHLPFGTKVEEISELFGKKGALGRVLLPPSGVTAIVEFVDPGEANRAFLTLSYLPVGNSEE